MKAIICMAIIGVSILGAGLMVGGRYAITLVDEPKYHASTRKSAQSFLKLDTLTGIKVAAERAKIRVISICF